MLKKNVFKQKSKAKRKKKMPESETKRINVVHMVWISQTKKTFLTRLCEEKSKKMESSLERAAFTSSR